MLRDFFLSNWKELTGDKPPEDLRIAPISSCAADYGNIIVMIFINGSASPGYVMKVSRTPLAAFKLENEFSSLKALSADRGLSPYIPTPYHLGVRSANTFFIQGGLPGTNLFRLIRKNGLDKPTRALIDESIDLLLMINKTRAPVAGMEKNGLEDAFASLEKELLNAGAAPDEIEEIGSSRAVFAGMDGRFFLHGDYWQTNIMADERTGRIRGVIDWEFSSASARAPTDIIHFLTNLAYSIYGRTKPDATVLESYRWGFFEKGAHNVIFSSLMKRYFSAAGLDTGLFRPLLEISLAGMSVRELWAYGRHAKMDGICMEMLLHTIRNREALCVI